MPFTQRTQGNFLSGITNRLCLTSKISACSTCNMRAQAKEVGGDESRLDTGTLGPEIATVKAQHDAGLLREEVFYLQDPHRSVRIRGIGDEAYKLVCDGTEIGEIDPFHLLREAPRNGIYSHGGHRYRVQDVQSKERRVRLAREYSPHFTTSAVRTSIRVRRLPMVSQHGESWWRRRRSTSTTTSSG